MQRLILHRHLAVLSARALGRHEACDITVTAEKAQVLLDARSDLHASHSRQLDDDDAVGAARRVECFTMAELQWALNTNQQYQR